MTKMPLAIRSAAGCAFAVLTLRGVTLPAFGLEFTTDRELAAVGVGSLLGAALRILTPDP